MRDRGGGRKGRGFVMVWVLTGSLFLSLNTVRGIKSKGEKRALMVTR